MSRRTTILRKGLVSAATAAALGFGATQALAAPGVRGIAARYCSLSSHQWCHVRCEERGYDTGWCVEGGHCECMFY